MARTNNVLSDEDIMKEVKDMIVDPLNQGRTAFLHNKEPKHNPYKQNCAEEGNKHMAWFMGFMEAMYIHQMTKQKTEVEE